LNQFALQERFDEAVQKLLEATESLHSAVFANEESIRLELALDRRDKAFERLRVEAGLDVAPTAVARACLASIRSLDSEMLERGLAVGGELRAERQSVQRRRSAIQAHSKHERGEPRLLTVKA